MKLKSLAPVFIMKVFVIFAALSCKQQFLDVFRNNNRAIIAYQA